MGGLPTQTHIRRYTRYGEKKKKEGCLNYQAILGRKFENPQERLLADLGKASSLFAPIWESLESAAPYGCALTAGEDHIFLREATPLLEESGFGVLVPSWWQRGGGGLRPGVRIKVRPAGKSAGASDGVGSIGSGCPGGIRLGVGPGRPCDPPGRVREVG